MTTPSPQTSTQRTATDKKTPKPGSTEKTGYMLIGLTILSAVALFVAVLYGAQHSAKGAFLGFLAALLGYAVGGIAGFMFGFPRYTDAAVVQSVEDLKAAFNSAGVGGRGEGRGESTRSEGGRGDGKVARTPSPIRHSTNLERITDWLMTMLIGATVINLKDLSDWSTGQFTALTTAIVQSGATGADPSAHVNAAPGALLVLPLMVAGFLSMYLWARRYLPRAWREADDDLYALAEELEQRQEKQAQEIDQLRTALYTVDSTALKQAEQWLQRYGVSQQVIDDVITRYRAAGAWTDDPMKGFGPAQAEGFRLSANVQPSGTAGTNPYECSISVTRVDGSPFSGAVAMLYHNSFDNPVEIEPSSGAAFTAKIFCSESFTIGAIVVTESSSSPGQYDTLNLSLDLGGLPNLPAGFKAP